MEEVDSMARRNVNPSSGGTGGTHEQTINTAFGEILAEMGHRWDIRSELIGRTFEEGGRPDILIQNPGDWPVVIEAEVANHRQAEIEAQSRLGNRLVDSAMSIDSAIALGCVDKFWVKCVDWVTAAGP